MLRAGALLFVPDTAVGGRRPAGKWHPFFHTISAVAFPLIDAVCVGVAEAARAGLSRDGDNRAP